MTQPVLTIAADAPVDQAVRLFMGHSVHHLPVVEEGRVVGMLSSADVAKLKFSLPPPGPARETFLKLHWRVREIMRSPALTVPEHESAQRAAALMAENGVHSLPVVNSKGILTGIVTTTDMMASSLKPSSFEQPPAASPTSNARLRSLEEVARIAKRYLNAGQDEHLHTALRKALERADLADQQTGQDFPTLGIGG